MRRVFNLLLNIASARSSGRQWATGPFSTKMSPRSCPGPDGWWLPVVCPSLMHRLLSQQCNSVVAHAAWQRAKDLTVLQHTALVCRPVHPPSFTCPPSQPRPGRLASRARTSLDIRSRKPAESSRRGPVSIATSLPPISTAFMSGSSPLCRLNPLLLGKGVMGMTILANKYSVPCMFLWNVNNLS